ncbi:MAG: hypothetical protein CVU88_00785 [Firmicutes bacterium HGW-Firmicutes-13]|nr:MAG: hypothetical protein CVU88_00785 [Firmicutes bacterium HGW-Firmicutes-13]
MKVYDQAHALAKALKDSDEYKNFIEAKDKLEEDEKAKEMFLDFRKYEFEFQKEKFEGKKPDEEKIERLKNMYEVVNMNLVIKHYLAAEYRFGKMMGDISKILGDAVNLNELQEITGTKE